MKFIDSLGGIKFGHTLVLGPNLTMSEDLDGRIILAAAAGGTTGSSTLVGLTDVSIVGPVGGQTLVYQAASAKWVNQGAGPISAANIIPGTFPQGTFTFAGTLIVGADSLGNTTLDLNGGTGSIRDLIWQTSGINRWVARTNATAEAGSDSGSDFQLMARNDAGGIIDNVLLFTRAAGGTIALGNAGNRSVVVGTDPTNFLGGSGAQFRVGGSVQWRGRGAIKSDGTTSAGHWTFGSDNTPQGFFGSIGLVSNQSVGIWQNAVGAWCVVVDANGNVGIGKNYNQGLGSQQGLIDGSWTRFGSTGNTTAYDVLSFDPAVNQWRPRFLQTQFTSAVVVAQDNGDGTFSNFAFSNPSLPANPGTSPGTPSTPIVTPIYKGMIIDLGTVPPANETYVLDYSINGAAYSTNAITVTSQKVVHSNLDTTKTYAYKVKTHYSVSNFTAYSTATAAFTPLATTEVNAFGLVVASQISTANLAAINANLGIITAGQIRNAAKTTVMQLDTTFALDAAAINGIFFAGANPIPAQITGLGLDFTATGTNALLKHSGLRLNADGSAIFNGKIDITDPTISLTGLNNSWIMFEDHLLAHGITGIVPTTVAGVIGEVNTFIPTGGIFLEGFASNNGPGIVVNSTLGSNGSPAEAIRLQGFLKSGTGRGALAATDTILNVLNAGTALLTVMGNGAVIAGLGGSATGGRVLGLVGQVTNVSTGALTAFIETSITTISLPAGTLATNGDRIHIHFTGADTGGFDGSTYFIKFGATKVVSLIVGANQKFDVDVLITRTGAATQLATAKEFLNGNIVTLEHTAPAETLSGAITIDFRVSNAVNGFTGKVRDVVVEALCQ